jgi:hypothetical protein
MFSALFGIASRANFRESFDSGLEKLYVVALKVTAPSSVPLVITGLINGMKLPEASAIEI